MSKLRTLAVVLAGLPLLAGCADDDATPVGPEPGNELFARFFSLGNSITAGFQSSGIVAGLQDDAFPVLLADRAGAQFNIPGLFGPGCPQPMVAPLTPAPKAPEGAPCFRVDVPGRVNNLAVPGAAIRDLLHLPSDTSTLLLNRLLIGNRTQLDALLAADPTFVTVFIGNNDVLRPALVGEPALITPTALFAARADTVAARVAAAGPEGAVFIGVVDPRVAPLLQVGKFFFLADLLAKAQGKIGAFPGKTVSPNCAPGTPGGENLVSLAILSPAAPAVISCDASAPLVLGTGAGSEAETVQQRVAAFNAALQTEATERNFLFLNPNTVFEDALKDPSQVRKCQGLSTVNTVPTTPQQFQAVGAAIQTTCPALTDPKVGFGNLISFDGVHPSAAAHVLIANTLAALINDEFGTTLPIN